MQLPQPRNEKIRFWSTFLSSNITPTGSPHSFHQTLRSMIWSMLGFWVLMDAIEKFEPSRGVKFKTYAELRIRGAMIDSLRELDWAPRSLRKKSKELSKASQKLQQELGREVSDQEICEEMGIELDELYKLEDQLTGLSVGSFYDASRKYGEDESDAESLINYYPDDVEKGPTHVFEKEELKAILAEAVDGLSRKERLVVSLYYFEELTMKEIGAVLRVNESRVSQLHTKAMLRLEAETEEFFLSAPVGKSASNRDFETELSDSFALPHERRETEVD